MFRSIVGCLINLKTHRRPYLSVIASILGSHMKSPQKSQRLMAKSGLWYLASTSERTLVLKPRSHTQIFLYVDATRCNKNKGNGQSRSGIFNNFGVSAVHASIHIHRLARLSSAVVEYIAYSGGYCNSLRLNSSIKMLFRTILVPYFGPRDSREALQQPQPHQHQA